MKKKATSLDISEYLDNEDVIAEYLSAILEENNMGLLYSAIGQIAKARGMSKIASASGMGRESLYKALNETAQPRFDTVMKVLKAMDIQMKFTPVLQGPRTGDHVARKTRRVA